MRPFRLGLLLALAVAAADQFTKYLLIEFVPVPGSRVIEVTGFLDIVHVRNQGVSFGLFGDGGATMKWVLLAVALVISIALVVWLSRARYRLTAAALGLILGGAVGNLIDRAHTGAVTDFIDLHWRTYHWPAFNLADSAITIGVVLLLWEALFGRRESTK